MILTLTSIKELHKEEHITERTTYNNYAALYEFTSENGDKYVKYVGKYGRNDNTIFYGCVKFRIELGEATKERYAIRQKQNVLSIPRVGDVFDFDAKFEWNERFENYTINGRLK
jgi:hypothetical protein